MNKIQYNKWKLHNMDELKNLFFHYKQNSIHFLNIKNSYFESPQLFEDFCKYIYSVS